MSSFGVEQITPFVRKAHAWACNDLNSRRPQHCDETSNLLAIGLHWLGLKNLERMTSFIPTRDPTDPDAGHVWLRWNGEVAIDATASQFSDQFGEQEVVVQISDWHNRLIEKQPPKPIDDDTILNFADGTI